MLACLGLLPVACTWRTRVLNGRQQGTRGICLAVSMILTRAMNMTENVTRTCLCLEWLLCCCCRYLLGSLQSGGAKHAPRLRCDDAGLEIYRMQMKRRPH